ncbi:PAAR domain-containing protein [Trinickia dinghuensis]|uniref:PAAR domain-containing protein n=1 Tax=Trinickia dinghuensis TaxID=2291023 RepID=A0A3D8K0Z8_9BURK|nr:PAAR domain-containing protein [Trinickia dinghuensis]RDU98919.1 PAAR domain-containing protein [Trinickia dinghuensis]
MKRSHLMVGDKSSAGGTVVEGIPLATHKDTELTFVGAQVSCPACKSVGRIVAQGPRWPGLMMGKQRALEGDICACKCEPPPVMRASQSDMFESYEGHDLARMGYTSTGESMEHAAQSYDQHFRIINSDGEPVEGLPYLLKTQDGTTVQGVTSANGKTDLLSANNAHDVQFLLHLAQGSE